MRIVEKIIGIALMVAGIAVWSIDYFIVKSVATIGTWLAELMNAPAGVGTGITVNILCFLLGLLVLVAIAGGMIVMAGIEVLTQE